MSEIQSMPSVKVISVPWTIAASVSDFRIVAIENDSCQLEFDAFWGHHCTGEAYRRVTIKFDEVAAFYYGVYQSDSERGGREALNWSSVFTQPNDEADLKKWLESTAAQWMETGDAPDSKFYAVEGSAWVDEYYGQATHFILSGADAFVEVLARRFTWS